MQRALLLFTKVPKPGRVKTRLIGAYGMSPADASNLYSAILRDIFDIMNRLSGLISLGLYVCYAPQGEGAKIEEMLSSYETSDVCFFPQDEKAVTGQRVAVAFDRAFNDGNDIAVLVFGDEPELDEKLLIEAFRTLEAATEKREQRIVLGPTCDGGTYLIGLTSGAIGWLHRSIDCTNTSKAVSKLVVQAQAADLPFTILGERIDLDDPDDLMLLLRQPRSDYSRTNSILKTLPTSWSHEVDDRISVIIPTLDEEKTIEATIQSVRTQPSSSEIIVVDGGSSDRTLQIANRLADRVVIASKPGRSHQENVGAKGAKGDILLFLHADAVISPTLLQSVRTACEDHEVVVGGAHLAYSPPERFRYRALCTIREIVSNVLGISGMGASFFVRRSTFWLLGGFDEEMNEEAVDMCKRIRGLGKHVMLDEVVQTSSRRYENSGFLSTVLAWALTVALTYVGIPAVPIERYIWRVVR